MATANSTAPRTWLRLIVDHNPFFLLSGLCMLFGCFLLNGALYTKAGDVGKLVILLLVINAYEAMIIPLGLTLIRRGPLFKRDGRMLLVLELLFLIDITFTNGVISTVDARWGWLIALGVLILAAVKLGIILRVLRLPHAERIGALALLQVAMLLSVPAVYKQIAMIRGPGMRDGDLPILAVYLTWIIVGLLPVIGGMLWHSRDRACRIDPRGKEIAIGWFYLALPFASVIVHVYSAAWVYAVPFLNAYLAPVLLGLAIGIVAFWPAAAAHTSRLAASGILAAVLLSAEFPWKLVFPAGGMLISPLRLMLIASLLTSVWCVWRHRRWAFASCGVACLAGAALGPTLPIMWDNFVWVVSTIVGFGRRSAPRTTVQWGIVAVASAFVLLVAGAILSFKRTPAAADPILADAPEEPAPIEWRT